MTNTFYMLILASLCVCTLGTIIDLIHLDTRYVNNINHCLQDKDPVIISNPFKPSWYRDSRFVAMQIYRYLKNDPPEESLQLFMKDKQETSSSNHVVYDVWGLEFKTTSLSDSGIYSAKLVTVDSVETKSFVLTVIDCDA